MIRDQSERLPTPEAVQLATYMSDLSEEVGEAYWLRDIEYVLWHVVQSQTEPASYGRLEITNQIRVTLSRLSQECRGWIVWRDDETWVPLQEWEEIFREGEAVLERALGWR